MLRTMNKEIWETWNPLGESYGNYYIDVIHKDKNGLKNNTC